MCAALKNLPKKKENELRRIIKATEAPIPVSVTKNTGASNT